MMWRGSLPLQALDVCSQLGHLAGLVQLRAGVLAAHSLMSALDAACELGLQGGNARLNGGLAVARVVHERRRPRGRRIADLARDPDRCGGGLGGLEADHVVRHHLDLHEVLGQRVHLRVCVARAREAAQKVQGQRRAEVEVELAQHQGLHLEDFRLGVRIVGNVDKVADLGRVHLLVLRGDEHGRDADELQLVALDGVDGKEAVDEVNRHEERLLQQLEAHVDLGQPVDQDGPHLLADAGLALGRGQVVFGGGMTDLEIAHVGVDVVDILGDEERVVGLLVIDVLHARGQLGPLHAGHIDIHGADIGLDLGLQGGNGGADGDGDRLEIELGLKGLRIGLAVRDVAEDGARLLGGSRLAAKVE
eukprot:m.96821 g.96821  ORF g.96821 m.96821 type:complete len:362 (+) comp8646_c0_seq2:120-1205(+)